MASLQKTSICVNGIDYSIIKEFQHGIEGKTFLAENKCEKYVIKTVELNVNSGFKIWKEIKNEKISELYEYEELKDGMFVLRTEHVPGIDLMDFLMLHEKTKEKLAPTCVVSIINQIIMAVRYLHSCDIVHSDLKPENIIINDEKNRYGVKVIDLGQAKNTKNMFSSMDGNKGVVYANGTRDYIAPELLEQSRLHYTREEALALLKGNDVFAIGRIAELVAYFLLSKSNLVLMSNLKYLISCMKMSHGFRKDIDWCLKYINNPSIYTKGLY
jgi:serine/threonine protein kinase